MKNKPLALVLFLSLSLSILTVAFQISPVAAACVLSIAPDPVNKTYADYGTEFNVSVTVDDVAELFGFDFNITWDNTLITYSDLFNQTLDDVWGNGNWFTAVSTNGVNGDLGWAKFVVLCLDVDFNFTTAGSQVLFDLEFQVQGPLNNRDRQTGINFAVHKLSDPLWQPITHAADDGLYTLTGRTPILLLNDSSITASMIPEAVFVEIKVNNAENVEDFEFEIYYNTTLLNYTDITWGGTWGTGTILVNETNGNLTCDNSGTALIGNYTLITLEFTTTYPHIWKDHVTWTNDLPGKIYIQRANLSYSGAPDLTFIKGVTFEIDVPDEVDYTFSPIRGDIDNDGTVDIFDLRTVALHYDEVYDPYDLNIDGTVDIFDLVIIATNMFFTYP